MPRTDQGVNNYNLISSSNELRDACGQMNLHGACGSTFAFLIVKVDA